MLFVTGEAEIQMQSTLMAISLMGLDYAHMYVILFNISNQPVGCHAPCHADGEIEALEN